MRVVLIGLLAVAMAACGKAEPRQRAGSDSSKTIDDTEREQARFDTERKPEKVVEAPPSPIVTVAPREPAPFAQLLARTYELATSRLVSRDRQVVRTAVDEAVAAVAGEQGDLPAPGGSTSHAPGLVFQASSSKTMTELAADRFRTIDPGASNMPAVIVQPGGTCGSLQKYSQRASRGARFTQPG